MPVSKIRVFQTITDGSPLGFDAYLVLGWNMLDFSADCGISRFTRAFAVLMALDIYVAVKVGKLPIFMPKVELKGDDSKAKDATCDKGCTDLKFAISVIIAIFGNHSVLHIF